MKVLESLGDLHMLHSSSLGGTEIELTTDSLRGADSIDCPYDFMDHAERMIHAPFHSFSPSPVTPHLIRSRLFLQEAGKFPKPPQTDYNFS